MGDRNINKTKRRTLTEITHYYYIMNCLPALLSHNRQNLHIFLVHVKFWYITLWMITISKLIQISVQQLPFSRWQHLKTEHWLKERDSNSEWTTRLWWAPCWQFSGNGYEIRLRFRQFLLNCANPSAFLFVWDKVILSSRRCPGTQYACLADFEVCTSVYCAVRSEICAAIPAAPTQRVSLYYCSLTCYVVQAVLELSL